MAALVNMDVSPHQPHPPPKPPHIETLISVDSGAHGVSPRELVASPMTELANNFRGLSSSNSSCGSNSSNCSASNIAMNLSMGSEKSAGFDRMEGGTTPVRGKQLCFNSTASPPSDEELENDDGVNLQPPRPYTAREAAEVLLQATSKDTSRFQQRAPYRRKLFTKTEKNFNRLRRLNSCGTQSPRFDEKLIGRSKTVEISHETGTTSQRADNVPLSPLVNRARVTTAPPTSLNHSANLAEEQHTDKLFEISARVRSKSYNRHRSDSSTPLRGQPMQKECSPLRLTRLSTIPSKDSSKMSLDEDLNPLSTSGLAAAPRMPQTSTLQATADIQDFNDFFEQFSDDGVGMDDTDDEDDILLVSSDAPEPASPVPSSVLPQIPQGSTPSRNLAKQTPSRSRHASTILSKNNGNGGPSNGFDISPLAAPLLARKAKSKKRQTKMLVQKFASPMSMKKLLTGDIIKQTTKRGLFQDASASSSSTKPQSPGSSSTALDSGPMVPTSPIKCSPLIKRTGRPIRRPSIKSRRIVSNSPVHGLKLKGRAEDEAFLSPRRRVKLAEPVTPEKSGKTFASPKRFASPDTPSKIRVRQRRRTRGPYSRARSVTFSALRQIDPNIPSSNPLSKNYQVSSCPKHQEELKRGLERVASVDELYLGDHTERKLRQLQVVRGDKHPQLTHISPSALAKLLQQTPPHQSPVKYDIVDCRYPYEFAGGRIEHAINIHTQEQLYDRYFSPVKNENSEPTLQNENPASAKAPSPYQYPPQDTVLIFHCEFSSERAPRMMKTLREIDREAHKYPMLKYPELYLLKGGYKDFFADYPELCDKGYVRMLDENHSDDLEKYRTFRAKAKTWSHIQGGKGAAGASRISRIKQKRKLF